MSRSTRRQLSATFALLAMLFLIAGSAQLLHTHHSHDEHGCPTEREAGCASCEAPLLAALLPVMVALTITLVPAERRRVFIPVLLPTGSLIGRPTARGPPAC